MNAYARSRCAELERELAREREVHPFKPLIPTHLAHVNHWLDANEKAPSDIHWSLYPIGMVGRWIERAEAAEKSLAELREQNATLREAIEEVRFAPMGDNHHNAAACPYCRAQLAAKEEPHA